ncbi:MAG: NUDIX domain-containing protein [Acidimicrobiia bacterium]
MRQAAVSGLEHQTPPPSSSHARVAARVLMVDRDGAVLLFRGSDPARPEAGTWWFTPGGGVDPGETLEEAARREVSEETGFNVEDVGSVRFERVVEFEFEGQRYHQHEHFFAVGVDRFEPNVSGWTEIERRSMGEYRWWTAVEISASDETFYPVDLIARLDAFSE